MRADGGNQDGQAPFYMAAVESDAGGGNAYVIRIWYRAVQGTGDGFVAGVGGLPTTPYLSISDTGGSFSATSGSEFLLSVSGKSPIPTYLFLTPNWIAANARPQR